MKRAARLAENLPPDARVKRGNSINNQNMFLDTQLLVLMTNAVRTLVWQNTADGQKGNNPPEPILLPDEVQKKQEDYERNRRRAHAVARRSRRIHKEE